MNALWTYTAIDLRSGGTRRRGEISGESAAEVRASLRRIGLQVIDLRAPRKWARRREARASPEVAGFAGRISFAAIADALAARWRAHLRTRRRAQRAELFDGLATMLESGLPLLEATETLLASRSAVRSSLRLLGSSSTRAMLAELREQLRGGAALDEALAQLPSWFDATEVAMVRAAQHAGDLPPVLRRLADQHERAGELAQKLASALAYPAVIAFVGAGVAMFLSVKTLPDLARILESAGLAVPALTESVMGAGQAIVRWWPALAIILAALALIAFIAPALASRSGSGLVRPPRVVRRIAVAGFSLRLADLMRAGVPMVEALRVLAPTVPSAALRARILAAADEVERGADLGAALGEGRWFDSEYARLLEVGQASGELEVLLERLGRRYERAAKRLIDRLASLLEPLVILALAALIGIVVMAAILPLTRLQEILR